jgi:hypothetical protein
MSKNSKNGKNILTYAFVVDGDLADSLKIGEILSRQEKHLRCCMY